jgi:hypothetical protein
MVQVKQEPLTFVCTYGYQWKASEHGFCGGEEGEKKKKRGRACGFRYAASFLGCYSTNGERNGDYG